jgi:hypothetical protein
MKYRKHYLPLLTLLMSTLPRIGMADVAQFDCFAYTDEAGETSEHVDLNLTPIKNYTGPGKLQVASKGCYIGHFHKGYPANSGTLVWLDGSVYRGDFLAGSAHGQGEFIHRFDWAYSGTWNRDWPVRGQCRHGAETHACETTEAGLTYRSWTSEERIRVPVLDKRYLREFNLLRETAHLRSGLVFRDNEYDLVGMLPVNDHHIYYAGSVDRNLLQIRASIQMHKEYLRQLVKQVHAENRDRKISFDIDLDIAPSGEVVSCQTDFYPKFCDELEKIDFGIVDAITPQQLIIAISKYSWQPRIKSASTE